MFWYRILSDTRFLHSRMTSQLVLSCLLPWALMMWTFQFKPKMDCLLLNLISPRSFLRTSPQWTSAFFQILLKIKNKTYLKMAMECRRSLMGQYQETRTVIPSWMKAACHAQMQLSHPLKSPVCAPLWHQWLLWPQWHLLLLQKALA